MSDHDSPVRLVSVRNEIEAGAVVNALAEYGLKALAVGDYTAGFKAEAPGLVSVLVKRTDLARAQEFLAQMREQETEIDWSSVDVGEPAE